MDLQRAFVAAGRLLVAGPGPVGVNGLLPGFGDQREIELLVEAGFAPVQMKGDPATRISDIENVEIVFKDGAGYDTNRLLESLQGRYGEY